MKSFSKKLKKIDRYSKGLFWLFTCLLLLTTSMYVYLVNTAAVNGVRWGDAEQELGSLGATVSELESKYLSLKRSVTLATAYEKGFEDVRTVTFINTQKVGPVAAATEI